MADLPYAWEKFSTALYSLVTASPIKVRLEAAWIAFHTLSPPDFDGLPELSQDFVEIRELLTTGSQASTDRVSASIAMMSDDEAAVVAEKILNLTLAVNQALRDRVH